jgi:hypothetical protein
VHVEERHDRLARELELWERGRLRALASGRKITVTPRSTAYSQMLCRLVDWHAAMSVPTANRTIMRRLAGFGSAQWQAKAAPTHDPLVDSELSTPRRRSRATSTVEAADAEPAE